MASAQVSTEGENDPYFQEYVQNFLLSAREIIQTLEADILALERAPEDPAGIHRIFRGFHTLKGGARGAKWPTMADFAHRIETLLSRLRDGDLSLSAELVSLLLRAVDLLPLLLAEAQGEGGAAAGQVAALLAELEPYHHTDQEVTHQETRTAILGISASLRADLPAFLRQPDGEWVGDCYRGFDIIQLATGAAGLTHLAHYASQVADRLIPIENGSREIGSLLAPLMEEAITCLELLTNSTGLPTTRLQTRIDHLLAALQRYPEPMPLIDEPPTPPEGPQPLGEILLAQGAVTEQELLQGLGRQKFLGDILVQEGTLTQAERDQALATQKRQIEQAMRESAATIRVDVAKLNRLVNLAGELDLFQGRLEEGLATLEQPLRELTRGRRLAAGRGDLQNALEHAFEVLQALSHQGQQLSHALRGQVVALRMIPIGGLFHSFQRLVRDAARQSGKLVNLEIRGAAAEVDKEIAERLSDPFKHLLRNAIDHGIESPEQRQTVGKPPHGTITLRASHQGGQLCVEVEDDGRGMDRAQILATARQKQWLAEGEEPTPEALLELLFRPGFSTAQTVTELSGRGVGLDVVRQEITALHGSVQIDTRPGAGSRFHIRLPLTLAILDGVVVRVGARRFVLPTLAIVASLRPDPAWWSETTPEQARFPWQGGSLPLLRLHRLLGVESPEPPSQSATLLIVAEGGRTAGLLVDETLEQKQLLIKNLLEHFYPVPGIMGASILEDGQVALILDLAWLLPVAGAGEPADGING
ncbi:MAG: chemotaxis protein CheA [Magnetococcus sp. MYC-9]